jgi:DNA polymerase-3 subunit epsilon
VQLACALVDLESRQITESMDVIIRPDGWTIPAEVSAIHGITHEMAMDVGIPEKDAVAQFLELMRDADADVFDPPFRFRIAHNEQFDARIIRIALMRYFGEELADKFKAAEAYCTMRAATPIVKAPPTARMRATGRHHYKSPNLGECVRHFFDRDLDGAHNAMVDTLTCIDVYFAIQDKLATEAA